jgi:hypothetical protein
VRAEHQLLVLLGDLDDLIALGEVQRRVARGLEHIPEEVVLGEEQRRLAPVQRQVVVVVLDHPGGEPAAPLSTLRRVIPLSLTGVISPLRNRLRVSDANRPGTGRQGSRA